LVRAADTEHVVTYQHRKAKRQHRRVTAGAFPRARNDIRSLLVALPPAFGLPGTGAAVTHGHCRPVIAGNAEIGGWWDGVRGEDEGTQNTHCKRGRRLGDPVQKTGDSSSKEPGQERCNPMFTYGPSRRYDKPVIYSTSTCQKIWATTRAN